MASILVTGAEGGIGTELVSILMENGDRVFAAQLAPVAEHEAAGSLHRLRMDLADDASVRDGFAEIDRILAGTSLDAVVHCAAIAPLGPVELLALADFKTVLNVNTMGSLRVIHEAVPRLAGHGGTLILVSSLWGRASGPMVGAYAASKHAVEALADALRRETKSAKFHVVVVAPGVVKTGMLHSQLEAARALAAELHPAHGSRYGDLYRSYAKLVEKGAKSAITARAAALQIAGILRTPKPRARYRVGPDAKFVSALAKLLPDWALDRLFQVLLSRG